MRWQRMKILGLFDRGFSRLLAALANNAMHTGSAVTLRFHIEHIEDRWRGAGDGER